jgi:hypothetical protein
MIGHHSNTGPAPCPHENVDARFGSFTVGELTGVNIHLSIPKALCTCLDCGAHYLSPLALKELARARDEVNQPYELVEQGMPLLVRLKAAFARLARRWTLKST